MRRAAQLTTAAKLAAFSCCLWDGAQAATLPVPCIGAACGSSGFVSAGQATATQSGATLTVNQASANATLNWQSFNISADGTVHFVQPSASAVALNNIYDSNPSQIFGALNANGRVFLINQNGIIFGAGAQVNVGGLLASTLSIDPAAISGGLIAPGSNGEAAFQAFANGLASGAVTVSNGATLQTAAGGQILIFAPTISNQGTISAPGGQALLAAGSTIYLASSSNPNLRGMLVEVGGTGGTVTNGTSANSAATSPAQLVGQILAQDGNVTLAGLAVNQLGRVSATTSINENGSIRLQAGDHGAMNPSSAVGVSGTPQDGTGGTLVLGPQSLTQVTLDSTDASTTVASVPQLKSDIDMTGDTIQMLAGSVAQATSGTIEVTAAQAASESLAPSQSDGSRFYMAPGAELDVSGASIVLPVSSNVIPVKLEGTELADSPLQQNGPLMGQTVYVDVRQGTTLADISGEIADIDYNVIERNLTGGTITVQSHGDAILAPGAQVDLAGGEIQYTGGYVDTTNLITTTGQIVNIATANPNLLYTGIANSTTVSNAKWGQSTTYTSTPGTYEPGYVQGMSAGTLAVSAPQFILDASADTSTVAGIYQRDLGQNPSIPSGCLACAYEQVPQAATLIIGNPSGDFVVGDVTVAAETVLPSLVNADGSAFDPLTDPLPASYNASVLRLGLIGPQGFGNVSIYTNGEYLQPVGVALDLPAGGSFGVAANVIDIQGSIDVPDGSITAVVEPTAIATSTQDVALTLGPQASLSANGEWINDNQLLYPSGNTAALAINGGTVSLAAFSGSYNYAPQLLLAPGSVIDVSGGAQLTNTGTLNAGVGGSIDIAAETPSGTLAGAPPVLELGATLRGYGIEEGGSLSLTASTVCIAAADCSGGDPAALWLSPSDLASGGFSAYSVEAAQGALSVAPGTQITLQQQNLQLPGDFQRLPDQTSLIGLATPVVLSPLVRQPVNLTLTQDYPATQITDVTATLTVTADTPSLTVGAGASIEADPLADITLNSNVRILMDGTLRAPGGDISLNLLADLPEAQYNATQGIWLGSQGVLDASGTALIYLNDQGERTGTVYAGGTVSLNAARGYLELLPGSLINVAGTTGVINPQPLGATALPSEQVASAGGSLQLTAAEGIELGSTLEAAAGVAGPGVQQPAGGSFDLTLDATNRNDYAFANGGSSTFPSGAREIIVSTTQAPIVVSPGAAVPSTLAGLAYVSTSALQAAGFDSVSLKAASLPTQNGGATATPGSIEFVGDVTLSAGDLISLDAASYSVSPGAVAQVTAPYVEFGSSNQTYQDVATATPGTGTLDVSGGFIELYGSSSLQGIGSANFDSTGDLRLLGLQDLSNANLALPTPSTALDGGLYAAGNITLSAQQVYPTTLSQFVISADPTSVSNPVSGSILVTGSPGSNQDLLSAGGSVTLSAGTVTQEGVLRAPFGDIVIDAQSIDLGASSLTSTSSNGLTIPFGTTQGGLDWVYPLQDGLEVVYGSGGIAPPSQHVTLQGAEVNVENGAVIDVSGGGDLQAYEWTPGTGGTSDVLSQAVRPDQFAILSGLQANVAPYDPNISAGSSLQVGDAVYLSGLPGLPAGIYQLLPARYALLPGAFLVSPASSAYQDIQGGQSFAQPGGGTVISGYTLVAGTSLAASRTIGFDVVPASVVLQQATYTTTSGNQFFANQAAAAGSPPPRLPQDAGVLALIASDELTLDGTLHTAAADGGLGAEVDISSADILVTGGSTGAAQAGQIVLTTASLDALGAQTLLLGGLDDDGAIDTAAQSVEIASGANLEAPELLLTAQGQVTLDSGASIASTGTAPAPIHYSLSGDGAFLAVSAGAQNSVTRSGQTGSAGVLTLASGSSITANAGAVFLDATENVVTDGVLSIVGGDLAVQAPLINLGAAPAGVSGAVLSPSVLAAQGLRNLLLESGSTINLYGGAEASADTITLDAAGLLGFGGGGDVASLSATTALSLSNSVGNLAGAVGTGTGALALSAPDISFGGGAVAASGFSSVALEAPNALTATADGALSTDGALSITTSRITTGADVQATLSATGAVSLLAPAQPATLAATTALGGSLSISGASIDVATQILVPSGQLSLTSTGQLSIDAAATLSVVGLVQQYDGVDVASPGGAVTLTSSAGNVNLAAGSSINVSAGSGGTGGSLAISAPTGTVNINGTLAGTGAAGMGGTFAVDAQGIGDFGTLIQTLNTGGFTGGLSARLRGPGDLVIAADNAITAQNISLEADRGSIDVGGSIDAAGSQGGTVTLAAADALTVSGTIDAHATSAGGSGGTVALETTNGVLQLDSGALIDVSGAGPAADGEAGAGGTVLLRVPQTMVTDVFNGGSGVALNGNIVGSTSTTLEAFSVYQNTTGVISAADEAGIDTAVSTFMDSATPAATALLGTATSSRTFALEPGVEIDATTASNGTGTLALDTSWDLSTWRFGAENVPGVLTLRAQNGVAFDASLSDGFAPTSGGSGTGVFTLPTQASNSWSYRIVAGADFSAANPLTVQAANTTADVTLAAGSSSVPTMVRTGTGFIDVSAAGDFVLGNQYSVLYTAGVAGNGIPLPGANGTLRGLAYPTNGGDISINVDGDILGATTNQFVNDWLWRVGAPTSTPTGSATAWTVDFQAFEQGIGALGGGNVTIQAGGDIDNLSASIPSIGVQVGGTTEASSEVQVQGGGVMTVSAGGSILGGSYYVGAGDATLQAGADVGASAITDGGTGLAPIIGLGDANLAVTARDSVELAEIVNPTLLNRGLAQGAGGKDVYFSTYGADSTVNLTAVGGDVVLDEDNSAVESTLASSFLGNNVTDSFNSPAPLDILPPTLNVMALSGDIDIGRVIALSPSSSGNLQLFANQNVVGVATSNGNAGQLIISDADPSQLPSLAAPQTSLQIYDDIIGALQAALPDQHAATPVHEAEDQAAELTPARIVALNGSVEFQPAVNGETEGIWSAVPVQVVAGLDVVDLNLVAQNLGAADVTSVTAGRDITYPENRASNGTIVQDTNGIVVDGPGQLQLTAGGNIDLGTSNGVVTRANLVNPALPSSGASISVEAGIGAADPQYAAFISQYVTGSDQFDSQLVAFVQGIEGGSALTAAEAKQQFGTLSPQLQRTFLEALFFDLLRTYGSQAAASGNGDFAGAFAAIQTLFPGANPNLAMGQTNPYSGNIDLYFSQIYSEQGGNISLLAPGGEINVGLALPPTGFGVNKLPDQLGIVAETTGDVSAFAYNDFEVNQSRVFAADGGDILVWSTEGNIDAGAGAKTSISAPEVNIAYDSNGQPTVTLRAAIAGSGIQALAATPGVSPGNVYLFAPHGVVNANQAGIVAGNLTVAATAVLGTSNITVSGTSVGVPVPVTGLGAAFAGASSSAGAAANAAEDISGQSQAGAGTNNTPASTAALNFLDVFVIGLGEGNCNPDDMECLKQQNAAQGAP